jgi:hypothetical protein
MVAQLGRQHPLGQHILQLPGQSGLTENRFGILVFDLGQ